VFALSRFMGTSIAMIDLHYGHLAVVSPGRPFFMAFLTLAAFGSYGSEQALGNAVSLRFAWLFRLLHHFLEGP
jgi:hypothetical protein